MSESSSHEAVQAPSKLREKVESWRARPISESYWIDSSHIRSIASEAAGATESDKASVRQLFRKILIALPSWKSACAEIRDSDADLLYAPQEKGLREEENRKKRERRQVIDSEIARGSSPWLAHIRHNEQGINNPYIVGFYQDEGKIRTLYGERFFMSKRQIESSFFSGRNEVKEVNLLDAQFQKVDQPVLLKSKHWDALPDDLRQRFESGEILVTGGKDLYNFTDSEIDRISSSDDPGALLKHVQQSIQQAKGGYYLLYYGDNEDEEIGRTGVLMSAQNGDMKPVTATIDGYEFVIEVKGCGAKTGGFGKMQYRTGRDVITGGVERKQTENELARLNDNDEGDNPKSAGGILFTNNGYEQGYIIRLVPSTVRASFTGNEVYPEIDNPENVKRVVVSYSEDLARQIFAPIPKIMNRGSHSENIMVWGKGKTMFTDFSDHIAFSDKDYPHDEKHGGYMTPKQMLKYYIEMVKEIPGYAESRDQQFFLTSLSTAFSKYGSELGINSDDHLEIVTQKIWEKGGMAYQVFKARRDSGYASEGALHEFDGRVESQREDLGLDSEDTFVNKFNRSFIDLREGLAALREQAKNPQEQDRIDRAFSLISKQDILSDLDAINGAWQVFMDSKLPENLYEKLHNSFLRFVTPLVYSFSPIGNYILHESDVISSSSKICPENERSILQSAEQEAREKRDFLLRAVRDPHELYQLLTDKGRARKMVTFECYSSKR